MSIEIPDMKKYYDLRSSLYNLYDNDVYYGDLCGSVLHIRDKNRCINSMSTKIQNEHSIIVEFDDKTKNDAKKMHKICNEIRDKVGEFIANNANYIADSSKDLTAEEVIEFSKSKCYKFCDTSICGNTLIIGL